MKHSILILTALALTPASGLSQDTSSRGSESYVLEAATIVGGGGAMSSASFSATVQLEGVTTPTSSSSASYTALGAPALFGSAGAAVQTQPQIFGVASGFGTKDGGSAVTLFGRNLQVPGAGASTADVDGVALLNLTVLSNNVATATTAPGVNVFQNPLGHVDLTFGNQLGSSTQADAFLYTPAIVVDSLPVVDGQYGLSIHAPAGSILSMSYGFQVPGVAIPLFNLDGALEIITQLTPIMPLTICPPSGHFQMTAAIPDLPSLAGLNLPLQALYFDNLATLSGSFTNLELLHIQ